MLRYEQTFVTSCYYYFLLDVVMILYLLRIVHLFSFSLSYRLHPVCLSTGFLCGVIGFSIVVFINSNKPTF